MASDAASASPEAPRIVPFEPVLANHFGRLNAEWLERYFVIEPIDARVMADPQRHIIDPGGQIFFAILHAEVVGTCAVKRYRPGEFELTKMAVTASSQGAGLGRLLLAAAVDWFQCQGATLLFLESHSSLAPALALYERHGFRHRPRPFVSEYDRSDVYMEYRPNDG